MGTGCAAYFPFGYLYPLHNYYLNAFVPKSIIGWLGAERSKYIIPVLKKLVKDMTDWMFFAEGDDELMLVIDVSNIQIEDEMSIIFKRKEKKTKQNIENLQSQQATEVYESDIE